MHRPRKYEILKNFQNILDKFKKSVIITVTIIIIDL